MSADPTKQNQMVRQKYFDYIRMPLHMLCLIVQGPLERRSDPQKMQARAQRQMVIVFELAQKVTCTFCA